MKEIELKWLPMRTLGNSELKLKKTLDKLGIEYFIPTKKAIVRHARSTKEVDKPVIPSLIFIHTNWDNAYLFQRTNSRKCFFMHQRDKSVIQVRDIEMNHFMSFINNSLEEVTIIDQPVIGDRVLIKNGPMANMEGTLIKYEGKNYFVIQLKGMLSAGIKMFKKDIKVIKKKV